jgi:hypothetical protein
MYSADLYSYECGIIGIHCDNATIHSLGRQQLPIGDANGGSEATQVVRENFAALQCGN